MSAISSSARAALEKHQLHHMVVGRDYALLARSEGFDHGILHQTNPGEPLLAQIADDVRRPLRNALEKAKLGREPQDFLLVRSRDGLSYEIIVEPLPDAEHPAAFVIVVKPVSYAMARQTQRAEIQHRLRNTLAVIRSIARRTAATSQNKQQLASHLMGRFDAFARVLGLAMRSVDSTVLLEDLIREELLAQGATIEQRVRLSGQSVTLNGKSAEMLALAIHELITNSLKFGAIGGDGGSLEIGWERVEQDEDGHLLIRWTETLKRTRGINLEAPTRRGFGLDLLENGMAYDLRAKTTVTFRRQGLLCTIRLPLHPHVIG